MYFREISGNGREFGLPSEQPCTLAFSRVLADQEVLMAYNTSTTEARADCIVVDSEIQKQRRELRYVYGHNGAVPLQSHPDPGNRLRFVRVPLDPMQFVIVA